MTTKKLNHVEMERATFADRLADFKVAKDMLAPNEASCGIFDRLIAVSIGQPEHSIRKLRLLAEAFTYDQLEVFSRMSVNAPGPAEVALIEIAKIKDEAQRGELVHMVAGGLAREAIRLARLAKSEAPRRPDPAEMTEEWHARRFVDLYADRLRYCQALGGWFIFDGERWRKGDMVVAGGLAREAIQSLRADLPGIQDNGKRREFESAIRRAESLRTVRAILGLARSDKRIAASPEDFDSGPASQSEQLTSVQCLTGG